MNREKQQADLRDLQAIRRTYTAGTMEWWALSLAIDALIGVSAEGIADDIDRIRRASCTTQKQTA